jgi:hypothetical protein
LREEPLLVLRENRVFVEVVMKERFCICEVLSVEELDELKKEFKVRREIGYKDEDGWEVVSRCEDCGGCVWEKEF